MKARRRREGRKRKLRAVTLAGSVQRSTFDLTSEYVGGQPKHSAPIEVENPHDSGQKIIVFRKLRDDPLGRMHAHGHVDESQYLAGRHWQKAYEAAELTGAKAIDPTQEPVDGGEIAKSVVSDAQARALEVLKKGHAQVVRCLGRTGAEVLRSVLAHGMTIRQVTITHGFDDQNSVVYYGRIFQEGLFALAKAYGFSRYADDRRRLDKGTQIGA